MKVKHNSDGTVTVAIPRGREEYLAEDADMPWGGLYSTETLSAEAFKDAQTPAKAPTAADFAASDKDAAKKAADDAATADKDKADREAGDRLAAYQAEQRAETIKAANTTASQRAADDLALARAAERATAGQPSNVAIVADAAAKNAVSGVDVAGRAEEAARRVASDPGVHSFDQPTRTGLEGSKPAPKPAARPRSTVASRAAAKKAAADKAAADKKPVPTGVSPL